MRRFRLTMVLGGGFALFLLLLITVILSGGLTSFQLDPRLRGFKEPATDVQATAILATLPFSFVENHGQWDARAKFRVRQRGLTAWLEQRAITLQLTKQEGTGWARSVVVRLVFEGSSEATVLTGEEQQPGRYNYFLGDNPAHWHTGIPTYAHVRYTGLYEGIDLRVREQAGHLEYDLLVAPGADLTQVAVRVEGIRRLELTSEGSLRLQTAQGPIDQRPPITWYEPRSDHPQRRHACTEIDRLGGRPVVL